MADALQRSAYSSFRKYDPKMECNFIDSWMGTDDVVDDSEDKRHDADLHGDLAEWKPEQREKLLANLLEKLIPLNDSPGYAEDIILQKKVAGESVPTVAVMADGFLKNHRLLEIEYRVLSEAYKTIKDKIDHDAVIQRHSLESILARAELLLRNRRLGIEGDHEEFEQKRKAAFKGGGYQSAAFDFTPEKRSKIDRRKGGDNKARSATLNMLLSRFFQKLGPDVDGDITVLPEPHDLVDASKFEMSLFQMARPKLAWYLDTHGTLPFSIMEQMLVDAMAVGSSVDQSGEVLLQKVARRCNYKRPTSSFKRPKYEPKDELAACSFTPRIGRAPAPSLYRSRSVALKRDGLLTSWQRKELLDMEECTFQPNIHKGLAAGGFVAADGSAPQHRPFRRDANGFLREFEKKPVATGTTPRALPGSNGPGESPAGEWEWSLRSSSVPPGGSENGEDGEKRIMYFGNTCGLTENQKKERQLRDWTTHVRLSSNHMEVIRRPEGDQAVKQFAKRFLELRAAEQFKMQTVKRECQTNLGFGTRS
jgi:hypothetical protein